MSPDSRRELKRRLRAELATQLPHYHLARAIAWGGILIAVGVAWLMRDGSPEYVLGLWRVGVPALIAWNGVVRALVMRSPLAIVSGVQQVAIAAWLYAVFNERWGWTFQNSWPVVLIAVGVGIVLKALLAPGAFSGWGSGRDEERAQ